MNYEIILTSAVVASLISGLAIFTNGIFDRKSRRKELLMNISYNLAKEKTDLVLKIAIEDNRPATLQESIVLMETYYQYLIQLDCKGKLPIEAISKGKP
ncbi:MAG: hypothetical protein Q7U04_08550 [Bacteriovorax sp.]|nr:hypothetical protein [Bacteriovorax sp.]